jgi:aldose 1-epimerase
MATKAVSPSGEQVELAFDDQLAVVVEVGGGLRSYTVSGRDVLDGYAVGQVSTSGRGQVLIPWPNRLQDGSYEFESRRHQLALTEPEAHNAIHGLVRWSAWDVAEREPNRVSLEYVLSERGLEVRTTATNVGRDACPYGCGAHPYLTVGTETVDPVELRAPGATVLRSDERGLPIGSRTVEGTEYDFRRPRQIASTKLDNAFTDLERDGDRLARVQLRHPHDGTELTLWVDESYRYLMLFTGDPLPDVNRRSLAVEPMTCPPNAFRTGTALTRLTPGESATSAWGIVPSTDA